MFKNITFFVIIIFSIYIFALGNVNLFSSKSIFTANSQNVNNLKVTIEDIKFNKKVAVGYCPLSDIPTIEGESVCKKTDSEIKVSTTIKDNDFKHLEYYYVVSGGKIVGEGSEVVWSLLGVSNGKYSITVGVGKNNIIQSNLFTKTIEYKHCFSCHKPKLDCSNSTVEIIAPQKKVKSDSLIAIKAKKYRDVLYKFDWNVSEGSIVAGKESDQIFVKTNVVRKNAVMKVRLKAAELYTDELCVSEVLTEIRISKK